MTMNESLEQLAERIVDRANASDEYILEAAVLLRRAREMVAAGKAGETSWEEWVERNINLSKSRLRELSQMANADDPAAELDRIRQLGAKRQAAWRERQKTAKTAKNPNSEATLDDSGDKEDAPSGKQDKPSELIPDDNGASNPASPLRNGAAAEDELGSEIKVEAIDHEPERLELIEWARSRPISDVRYVLKLIKEDSFLLPPIFDRRNRAA